MSRQVSGPTPLLLSGSGVLSWGLSGQGVEMTAHLHLLAKFRNEWSYTLAPTIRLDGVGRDFTSTYTHTHTHTHTPVHIYIYIYMCVCVCVCVCACECAWAWAWARAGALECVRVRACVCVCNIALS